MIINKPDYLRTGKKKRATDQGLNLGNTKGMAEEKKTCKTKQWLEICENKERISSPKRKE